MRTDKRNDDTSLSDDKFFSDSDCFGGKPTHKQLIVMDDVSGLAEESKKFANFLTVACKFNYTRVYILHIVYPEKSTWRTILSQTNIFNIFPSSFSPAHVKEF